MKASENKTDSSLVYPWLKCLMGCTTPGDQEVTLLPCLHVICSSECRDKFLSELKAPDALQRCKLCFSVMSEQDVLQASKIVPDKEFEKKKDPPKVESIKVICEYCVDNNVATKFCLDCPLPLCDGCVQIHPRLRATKDHKILPSLEEQRQKEAQEYMDRLTLCQEHEKKAFTLWCSPCGKKLCSDCRPAHEGGAHQVFNLEEKRTQLEKKLGYSRALIPKLDELTTALENRLHSVRTQEWEKVNEQISKEFERVIKALLQREVEVKKEAKNVFLKASFLLQKELKRVEMCKKSTNTYLKAGEELLAQCDDSATVSFSKHADLVYSWIEDFNEKFYGEMDKLAKKASRFDVSRSATQTIVNSIQALGKVTHSIDGNQKNVIEKGPANGEEDQASHTSDESIETLPDDPTSMDTEKDNGEASGKKDVNGAAQASTSGSINGKASSTPSPNSGDNVENIVNGRKSMPGRPPQKSESDDDILLLDEVITPHTSGRKRSAAFIESGKYPKKIQENQSPRKRGRPAGSGKGNKQ